MNKKFHCLNQCSACCGPVPIEKGTWTCYKHLAREADYFMEDNGQVFPVRKDMECVFLNNHKCLIYEHRPLICRDYGIIAGLPCPFLKANGNKRSPAQTRKIERNIGKKYNAFVKEAGLHDSNK